MLHISRIIGGASTQIEDAIVRQYVAHLLSELGADGAFGEDKIAYMSNHHAPLRTRDKDGNPLLTSKQELTCRISSIKNPSNVEQAEPYHGWYGGIGTHRLMDGRTPLLVDTTNRILLMDHEITTELSLELMFKSPDRSLISSIFDRLMVMFTNGQRTFAANVRYNYLLPTDILGALFVLYKQTGMPPAMFVKWVQDLSSGRISVLHNTDIAERATLGASRNVSQLLGMIDLSNNGTEAVMSNSKAEVYTLTFSVRIPYSRPNVMTLSFPLSINNQLVPSKLIYTNADLLAMYPEPRSYNLNIDEFWRHLEGLVEVRQPCFHLPWYDTWYPIGNSALSQLGYRPLVSAWFPLTDPADPDAVTVLDMSELSEPDGDLPGLSFTQEVKDEIIAHPTTICYPRGELLLSVYRGDQMLEPDDITLDGLTMTIPNRNQNHDYRLVLSIRKDVLDDDFIVARILLFTFIVA